jgi:protein-serine/threonine kinase
MGEEGEYDPRPLDVWGAAIVMLCMTASGVLWPEARAGSSPLYDELIRGWSIWNAKHPSGTAPSITETDYPHVAFFDNHIRPPALRRVLLTMLNPDPSRRITMNGVANNRWMKNIACCQIDSYDEPKMMIDVSKSGTNLKALNKVVSHNHLPPSKAHTHPFVRLPGSVEMH